MAAPRTCYCRLCGGKARFIVSHRTASGRTRRYGCLESDCGIRWNERDDGEHSCQGCRHWLHDRCGLGLPEPLLEPDFGVTCPARAGQAF